MADDQSPDIELLLAQHDWINGLARRLVRDPHAAADLAQESMLRALAHPPSVEGDTRRLRGWLGKVIQNLVHQGRRTEAHRAEREHRATREAIAEHALERDGENVELIVRADLHRQLVDAVLKLPEPSRSAILWRYFEGRSVAAIARREGLDPGAVRKRIARGVERLRVTLDEHHDGDRDAWCLLLMPLAADPSASGVAISSAAKWAAAAALLTGLSLVVVRGLAPPGSAPAGDSGKLATVGLIDQAPDDGPPTERLAEFDEPGAKSPAREPASAVAAPRDPADDEASLTVRVVSELTGEPLADVQVLLAPTDKTGFSITFAEGSAGKLGDRLQTDVEGVVEIATPAGNQWVLSIWGKHLQHTNLEREVAALNRGEERELAIRLPPGESRPYYVQLVDAQTQLPIEGAEFRGSPGQNEWSTLDTGPDDDWNRERIWKPDGPLIGRSDDTGGIELAWVSWQMTSIRVFAPGYGPASISVSDGRIDPTSPMVVPIAKSARVMGYVTDINGHGIEGLTVGVNAASFFFDHSDDGGHINSHTYLWATWTGVDGGFELADLPAGQELSWEIREGNLRRYTPTSTLQLEPGEERDLSRSLAATHTVRGRMVTEGGRPVEDAPVQLQPTRKESMHSYLNTNGSARRQTRTDPDGRFEFTGVTEGEWLAGPAPAERGKLPLWAPYGVRITVPGNEASVTAHAHFIEGHVLTDEGAPLSQASVTAGRTGEGSLPSVRTDSNGHYRVGPLAPGEHSLRVSAVSTEGRTGWIATGPRDAQAGSTDIDFTMIRSGAFTCLAVDASTGQAADARFYSYNSAPGAPLGGTTAEHMGSSSYGFRPPGSYVVVATTEDTRIGILRDFVVEAGVIVEAVEIEVAPGARLELVVDAETQHTSYSVWSAGLRVAQVWLAPGTSQVLVVPSGVVRVVPAALDGSSPGEGWVVTLEVGEVVKLNVD